MATPNDPERRALGGRPAPYTASAAPAPAPAPQVRMSDIPQRGPGFRYDPVNGVSAPAAAPAPTAQAPSPVAPSPAAPKATTPAPAAAPSPSPSTFNGQTLTADDYARAAARDSRGVGTGLPPTPPPAGRMERRSVVDEFNATREGLSMPRSYDPTGARLRGRADAFNITNPRSRERELVDLAVRVANDSSLKGFTGARNAIIGQIMGQLDAGNAASLEAQQQAGRAGLGLQGFEQDSVLQETDRRGARLRDQFLEEGQMRLARLNNDADLEQTDLAGQYQLDAAKLGGRGSGNGNTGSDERKRADEALEAAREANPDDPIQGYVDAYTGIVDQGIDPNGLPGGQAALQGIRNALRAQYNDGSWLAELDAAATPGVEGNDARLGYDFDVQDLEVLDDQPWTLDLVQFFSPESVQPYVARQRGKPGTEQIFKPALGAPSQSQLRRFQEADAANNARRYSAASARDPNFVRDEREAD